MGSETVYDFVRKKIALSCDRVVLRGATIYFCFDSRQKWTSDFLGMAGIHDAVVRAFSMGFSRFVFVRDDGQEFGTDVSFWMRKEGGYRGRSR
jgi:hypothetical protein